MEPRITGREIALFIAKFRLWDAYLDTDLDGDCIDLRAPGYGCDECSYTLLPNGLYDIEAWISDDHWKRIEFGNIFDFDKVEGAKK